MTDPAEGPAEVAAAKLAEVRDLAADAQRHWHEGDHRGALEILHRLMPAAAIAAGALTVLARPATETPPQQTAESSTGPAAGYELVFTRAGHEDVVRVHPTGTVGPGGYPIYADPTGAVRAEISDSGETRMLATTGHQAPQSPAGVRPLTS
ncbi:DUF6296 family protein [Kitasatospora sp. LaBMicrA B282]|uniref:DUF6296 family protein n=1 Tax=Kitasatospora sp. LaBMicrA B282 TaxID=3420949 RepID=UPI003D0F7847